MSSTEEFLKTLDVKEKNPLKRFLVRRKGLFGYNLYYTLGNPKHVIRGCLNNIKWFIQRGRRGWSDKDAWSLDYYLCSWMPDALEALQNGHSYPGNMTPEEWHAKLEEMRQAFLAHRKIMGLNPADLNDLGELLSNPVLMTEQIKVRNKGLKTFVKHFGHLWD